MSNAYTVTTNFGAKDSLASGNPAKLILGAQFTTEFTNLFNALAALSVANPPTWQSATGTLFNITDGTDTFRVSNSAGNVSVGTSSNSILTFVTNGVARGSISTGGLFTLNNGLTVNGGAFTSRGIADNATANALTINSAGNATLSAPTSGTTLGLTSFAGAYALQITGGSFGGLQMIPTGGVFGTNDTFFFANSASDSYLGVRASTTTLHFLVNGADVATATNGAFNVPNGTGTVSPVYAGIPQGTSLASASATLVLSDANRFIPNFSGAARTATIPANASVAYPVGTAITFIEGGSAAMTIAINTDTLQFGSLTGTRTLAANSSATAIKVAATTWFISGQGLT